MLLRVISIFDPFEVNKSIVGSHLGSVGLVEVVPEIEKIYQQFKQIKLALLKKLKPRSV